MSTKPTLARILELLDVDTQSGVILWRRSHGRAKAGTPAGRIHKFGYRGICMDMQELKAHAIVWFVATGEWAPLIDHIDGDRAHNAFANLRAADAATNARNRTNFVHRKLLGAYQTPQGSYKAAITADGQAYHLGVFKTEQEAHERYCDARKQCALAELLARTRMLEAMQKGGAQ